MNEHAERFLHIAKVNGWDIKTLLANIAYILDEEYSILADVNHSLDTM